METFVPDPDNHRPFNVSRHIVRFGMEVGVLGKIHQRGFASKGEGVVSVHAAPNHPGEESGGRLYPVTGLDRGRYGYAEHFPNP